MLMALGLFVFTLQTAPFQERRRTTSWRWPTQSRVGARPAAQYTGPGDDLIELTGVLMPEITGGPLTLEALRAMAAQGSAWPLLDAAGLLYGLYVIEDLQEGASHLMAGGLAQRIEFSIRLRRTDDYNAVADTVSAAAGGLMGLFG